MKLFTIAATALALASCSSGVDIRLTNELPVARCGEMVEVALPASVDKPFVLVDPSGNEVAYQITHDGTMVFEADVPADTSVVYVIKNGTPSEVDTVAYGRLFAERLDDLAWENDKAAYRAYGPALQATGERAYGYDVWTKSTPKPVLEKRYYGEKVQGVSYHEDHGEGMDAYGVGPTLGGGTAALLHADGNLRYPECFTSYEVLDNGPLRFSAKLVYDSDTVVETRVITLDKGSFLNRTSVTFDSVCGTDIAPGIVVHAAAPDDYVLADAYMAYADPTQNANNGNGRIYVGVVVPGDSTRYEYRALEQPVGDAVGHLLGVTPYKANDEFVYYWGSGWSKGYMPSMDEWKAYLADFAAKIESPIKVEIER